MNYIKIIFLFFLVIKVNSLTLYNNSIIMKTEELIRNTFNKLFLALKYKNNQNKNLNQQIHNFFTGLTYKDDALLQHISKLSKSENHSSENLLNIINEIEDFDEITGNINVFNIINEYLSLENYKESNSIQYNINDILDAIQSDIEQSNKDEDEVNEFWVPSINRRIFQGDRTKIKHFPFMASVLIFKNFQCGGSIISSDLVVTAASCLQLAHNNRFFRENSLFLSVRVGSTFVGTGGESIPVIEVYFHPEYSPKTLKNNISVMRLRRHLNFRHRRVKKIDFDREEHTLPVNTPGITIVGWGARTRSNILDSPLTNRLAFSVLDIYPLADCQDVYSREYVNKKNFCAGFLSRGSGACNKDVGNPGVAGGKLVGIASFGSPVCGTPDAPTVFTKVGYYADWIEEIMEMEVVQQKVRTTTSMRTPFTVPTGTPKTTFKMAPIGNELTPSLLQEDVLRQMKHNILEEFEDKIRKKDRKKYLKSNNLTLTTTPMVKLDPITVKDSKYTIIDIPLESQSDSGEETDKGHTTDSNIGQKTETTDITVKVEEELDTDLLNLIRQKKNKKTKTILDINQINNIDDAILTLLYLSDNEDYSESEHSEGLNISIEESNSNTKEVGLDVAMEGFKDLTFRNNDTLQLIEMLPKEDIYDLLSEALDTSDNKE